MMKFLAIAGLAVLAATPALAASGKKKPRAHHVQSQAASPATVAGYGDSYAVRSYTGTRIVGRDPDPNVRQMLQAEDAFFRNAN